MTDIIAAYQAAAIRNVSADHVNQENSSEDIFPAMVWHYMRQPYSQELIKKRKLFEVLELIADLII